MGIICQFVCPKCDSAGQNALAPQPEPFRHRSSGTALGCGIHYPQVCESIYKEIRSGKLGPQAKRAMFWLRRPGIYCNKELFVCNSCKRWHAAGRICICKLKPGQVYTPDFREKAVAKRLAPLCGIDEEKWEIRWERKEICRHCGGQMHPKQEREPLLCHRCGTPLEKNVTGHWD